MCKGSWASRHGWGWNLPSIWVCLWSGPTQEVFWDKWVFYNGSDQIQLTSYWTYDVRNTVSSFFLLTLNFIDIVFMHVSIMHEINREFFFLFQERWWFVNYVNACVAGSSWKMVYHQVLICLCVAQWVQTDTYFDFLVWCPGIEAV